MPSPPNLTNITPPRVPLVDERTGLISREWYRFFLNLFNLTGEGSNTTSLTDLQLGPIEDSANEQIAELAKQVEGLEATLIPALGTFAALQQANLPWTTFDTTPESVPSVTTGTLYWDNEDRAKTLALVMEDTGDIIQDIGEDTFYRVKATATITKGQVLMFTGTVGASGGLLAAPATGLNAFQGEYILGIATQNIALNGWGYATWFGEVSKVNTTGGVEAWVDGQILYYNPAVAGGLTKNVPTAPNPKVIVASVVHAATNGILFVRPTFGSALGATDSNVEITSLTNGDILQYDGTQLRWENVPASTLPVGTATNLAGGAAGSVPYQSAASTTAMLPIGTALQVLKVNAGATAPQWVSGAALTKVDDTNVTLTLGGTPATSLLAATSLTLGWTGQLGLTRGGTNASLTASAGSVAYSTASALALNTAGSSGDWLKSAGTAAPTWTAPAALTKTDDTNVTLTLGGSASTALLNAASLTLGWTGQLAVTRGGTGTATAFTAGSVVFAGALGVYSQDNANFFWDDTNNRLGLGITTPTCALDVVGGIKTSRTGVTSPAATDGNVFSGTYTAAQVSTNTNVDAVTFGTCQYMRVGNVITVSGQIGIDATTTATDTIVRMSIPVASTFSSARQLAGAGVAFTTPYAANSLAILADTTNFCAELRARPSVNTNLNYNFSFTYRVI